MTSASKWKLSSRDLNEGPVPAALPVLPSGSDDFCFMILLPSCNMGRMIVEHAGVRTKTSVNVERNPSPHFPNPKLTSDFKMSCACNWWMRWRQVAGHLNQKLSG